MEKIGRPPVIGQEKPENVQKEADNIRGTIEGCQDEKEKWEMCFDSLLADRQGIELFRKYLENVQDKQGTKLIGMWLIYEGMRTTGKYNDSNELEFIKNIYKIGRRLIREYFGDGLSSTTEESSIGAEVVREAFRRLESSRNKTNADGLKKAFEQSQNCIRSHLELNQYKTFLESQFYKSGSHLPPIDEDKIMPPPSTSALTADNLKSSQSARLHSSASKYYDSSRIYYAPYGSHNNSEYASQSSDTCTSDALSFTTDTTDTLDDPRSRKRREKKTRRIHINRNPNERPGQFATDRGHAHDRFIQEVINPSEPNLAEKHPRKFFKILEQKLRPIADKRLQDERLAQLRGSGPDETDELDNEAILSEHIDRTLNSGHRTPNQAGLTAIVSKKHSNVQDNQQFIGSLPIYRDVSSDADSKVGEWLTQNQPTQKQKKSRPSMRFNTGSGSSRGGTGSAYASNSKSIRERTIGRSAVSIDSGLSSRLDSEIELNGVKSRLVQEIEGTVNTTLVYHFENEKYKIKVPGRPPTLASFRSRFHMASTNGIFRYFFKSRDEDDSSPSWIEITDPNEPLPTVKNGANNQDETIVEAKVIQG